MAYTIRVLDDKSPEVVADAVRRAIQRDGRFSATVVLASMAARDSRARRAPRDSYPDDILISKVRLLVGKEYCGQHPGECIGPARKRKRMTLLEWTDWVAFNGVVNDALNALGADADAWSTPAESINSGKRFYVRRGRHPRIRFEWDERLTSYGGSPDQFGLREMPKRDAKRGRHRGGRR